MKVIYEEILKEFVSKERPQLLHPFGVEGYYMASDTYRLVAIPKSLVELDLEHVEDKVSRRSVELIHTPPNQSLVFKTEDLLKKIGAQIAMVDEMDDSNVKECPKCKGGGDIECFACGHIRECDECRGPGEIGRAVPTGHKIPDPDQRMLINGVLFRARLFTSVIKSANKLNQENVEWLVYDKGGANIFKAGDVSFVCMSIMQHAAEGETYGAIVI